MKRRYSEYKDSGIEWIGEIPSHWEVVKLGRHISILSGFPFKSELFDSYEGFPILRIRDITSGKCETFYKGEFSQEQIVTNNDLLIGMDGDFTVRWWEGGNVLLNQRCCCVWGNPTLSKRFLYYSLPDKLKIVNDLTYFTTVKHLSNDDIKSIRISLPPLHEQEAIVRYLDDKTSQIDSLLSLTEKKIELLKEKRTALINHAVTKGLNPDAPMKDSGIEWIGEIPSHWEVVKMKHKISLITEKGTADVSSVRISPENVEPNSGLCYNLFSEYLGEGVFFEHGDILLNKLRIYLKKILLVEYSGYSMGEMLVLRTKWGFNKFYYYLFFHQGLIDFWDSQSNGVKLPRVSPDIITNSEIPFPPLHEQEAIVRYLDEKTSQIDSLIAIEQKRMETLKEYRQSLISEVVTGKIRVCEEVNPIAL
jgi:type I restriction enzyme S subunit